LIFIIRGFLFQMDLNQKGFEIHAEGSNLI
jgi:hypothetical protein